jgi:hypothetical protein
MDELFNISLIVATIIPAVIGLTQVFKKALQLDKRFIPLTSVILGMALCISILFLTGNNPWFGIFGGIVAGLSACGLYSGAKATVGK